MKKMDQPLSAVSAPEDAEPPWSDSHSMESDDGGSMLIPQSPLWIDAPPSSASTVSAMSLARFGRPLSPMSTGVEMPGSALTDYGACFSASSVSSSSVAQVMTQSASSVASADSWSLPNVADNEMNWDPESDGSVHMSAKLEPMDEDDAHLDEVKEEALTPGANHAAATTNTTTFTTTADPTAATTTTGDDARKVRRPRGRPRKHPLPPIVTTSKVTKGRSKTGCLTCRKRKKKCDEAKPRCMNCEKNAVVCEGYPEKQIWKSGRQRAEERLNSHSYPSITMQPIFHGLETVEDMIFWKHYNEHLSTVLTVEGEHRNAFKTMLVPIAVKHQGLMHSILALSSKHLDYDTPYGTNLLAKTPNVTIESLQRRSAYHHERAMQRIFADIARDSPTHESSMGTTHQPSTHHHHDEADPHDLLKARYCQMLCLLLEAISDGNPRGEHRVHLHAYQKLIQTSPPDDPEFLAFITEFFQYHIFADELIRYPPLDQPRLASEDWEPVMPIDAPRLLGVADGLFNYLSQITSVRNTIRMNMQRHVDPIVDYPSLYRAAEIDAAIREWTPNWPSGDSRDLVSLLYKQMMWVYLFRTIYPPSPSTLPAPGYVALALPSVSSRANTPPRSPPTGCSTPIEVDSDSHISAHATHHHHPSLGGATSATSATTANNTASHNILVAPTAATTLDNRAESPAPIRYPPNHDPRVTIAVEESLDILDNFKPSNPCQTLLLIPCLVIGTACFTPGQRDRIRAAVRAVRGYTGLANAARVSDVLNEVWRLMDRGDWAAVWDWQAVATKKNLDFLCS